MRTTINGRQYEVTGRYEIEMTLGGDLRIIPQYPGGEPVMVPMNRCEHCGRSDWVQIVYHSVEEATEAGLFVEVPPS
jgi:hypothetical protein